MIDVLSSIRDFLRTSGVQFEEKHHAPTKTSEESAAARGESMEVGAKALLLKTDDVFRLFVLPADRALDSGAIRKELHVNKMRFASPEELLDLTGLVSGSVPPFGEPILPFELYADTGIGERRERV